MIWRGRARNGSVC